MRLSELPEARARYEEALPLYHAIGSKLGEANCIQSLGDVAVNEKDYDAAFKLYEEAVALCRAISPADEASALHNIANAYESQKDYAKALETYTRAMALFPRPQGYILRNRANIYLKLKDADNAARDIEAAAQVQPNNAYLFLRRGELAILLEHYTEAIQHFQSALELYPRMNGAYFGIGRAHLLLKQVNEALAAYQQGLAVSDARSDLEDALEELEKLKAEKPALNGVSEILALLQNWQPITNNQ
jgi:tetratricopeptide (TPR) repeat protein